MGVVIFHPTQDNEAVQIGAQPLLAPRGELNTHPTHLQLGIMSKCPAFAGIVLVGPSRKLNIHTYLAFTIYYNGGTHENED